MTESSSLDAQAQLYAALAKAQGQFGVVAKSSSGARLQGRQLKFASLGQIYDATHKPLSENGLSVSFSPQAGEEPGSLVLRGTLCHSGGGTITALLPVDARPTGGDSKAGLHPLQLAGKGLAYARRLLWAMLIGVAIDDVDYDSSSPPSGHRDPDPRGPDSRRQNNGEQAVVSSPAAGALLAEGKPLSQFRERLQAARDALGEETYWSALVTLGMTRSGAEHLIISPKVEIAHAKRCLEAVEKAVADQEVGSEEPDLDSQDGVGEDGQTSIDDDPLPF